MRLIRLIKGEDSSSFRRLVFMAVVSGLANALLLAVINTAAEKSYNDVSDKRLFLVFFLTLFLFVYTKNFILHKANIIVETVLAKYRLRISNKIRFSDLRTVERIEKSAIFARLTSDASQISQAAPLMIDAVQSAIMLIFSIFYIFTLSQIAFFVIVVSIGVAVMIYEIRRKKIIKVLEATRDKEVELFQSLSHVIDGFKEVKVNSRKSGHIFEEIKRTTESNKTLKIEAGKDFNINFLFSQIFFYVLLGVCVFILPKFIDVYSDVVMKLTAAILFIIGPMNSLVGSVPIFSAAGIAMENIDKLESEIEENLEEDIVEQINDQNDFVGRSHEKMPFEKSIELKNIEFVYDPTNSFKLGPINFELKKGELVFLIGGNGSGKSTFLKTLTGLYPSTKGGIYVDGNPVLAGGYQEYRDMFSVLFTDFHLFDKVYGLEQLDEARVEELLKYLKIDHKTQFKNGMFSTQSLSTGQRKRLAMVITFMEDKDVYIYDEVAADQDPEFRKFFYEEILRDLVQQGKTVIAATHDDHYFHLADRVVKMVYGKLETHSIGPNNKG